MATKGRGGGGERQGRLTPNSSGLRGQPTSLPTERDSWILPASGPRLGSSARPERGQGTVSWRTCLAFPSAHSDLGRFSLLSVPLGENYGRLAPRSGRDKLNFRGRGPTLCSTDPTRGPLPPHSRLCVPPIGAIMTYPPPPHLFAFRKVTLQGRTEAKPNAAPLPHPPLHTPKLTPRDGSTKRMRRSNWEQRNYSWAPQNLLITS